MNTKTLKLLLLVGLVSISSTLIASESINHTDTTILRADTIPDANLLNGIRYIRNGRLAAIERDSLRVLVGIQQKRIENFQNVILNFEKTVQEYKQRDTTHLAQIREYSKANDIYKIALSDSQLALKEQKKRNVRNLFLSGLAILALLTF